MSIDDVAVARASVFVSSASVPSCDLQPVVGPTFFHTASADENVIHAGTSLATTGFQASHVGKAHDIIRAMIHDRDPSDESRCIVYLGVVGNLFASGVRESLQFLARSRLLDRVVVSGGGIEHDLRRLFSWHDYRINANRDPRRCYLNNISYRSEPCPGNPDDCAACFPHMLRRSLEHLTATRTASRTVESDEVPRASSERSRSTVFGGASDNVCYSPSSLWREIGRWFDSVLPDPLARQSFLIQCVRHDIPVYSPSITDGDVALTLLEMRNPGIVIDLVEDLNALNRSALKAKSTGMIIIGGGVVKHHVCNANLMRNGADFAVYVSTAQEFDGSDGGARPDEAISWGKIKAGAKHVKVYGEATLVVPTLVDMIRT
jgi:deoxyhypusine synthase